MLNQTILSEFCDRNLSKVEAKKSFYQETLPLELALLSLLTFEDETQECEDIATMVFERNDFLADNNNILLFLEIVGRQFHNYGSGGGYTVTECIMEIPTTVDTLTNADPRRLFNIFQITNSDSSLFGLLEQLDSLTNLIQNEMSLDEIKEQQSKWRYFVIEKLAIRKDVRNHIASLPIDQAYDFCFSREHTLAGEPFVGIFCQRKDAHAYIENLSSDKAKVFSQFESRGSLF